MEKRLKILYAAGPGNVIGTYQHWVEGRDDPSQVSITWSGQFYDLCRELDAEGYIISCSQDKQSIQDGDFTLEHRPVPFPRASGILYHLAYSWYGLGIIISALKFRARAVVVSSGTTHWFILSILPFLGIKIIPTLQCVSWRKYLPQKRTEKVLFFLSRRLFNKDCTAILSMSKDISEQIKQITNNSSQPILEYLPIYRRSQFDDIRPPEKAKTPFRVLFVGRIEANKGVFDLLKIAQSLTSEGKEDIVFDLCGRGSALEALKLAIQEADLESIFLCHGHCNKPKMREMYSQSHVVIVPTRTDFIEGFNMVVAEAVLAGRPVVTSSVCPAINYVRDAVIEVPPNDTKAYAEALVRLLNNDEIYEEKRQACLKAQAQFYDLSKSWGSALKGALMSTIFLSR